MPRLTGKFIVHIVRIVLTGLMTLEPSLTGHLLFGQSTPTVERITILKRDDISPGEAIIVEILTQGDVSAITGRGFDRDFLFWKEDTGRFRGLIGLDRDTSPGDHQIRLTLERETGEETETTLDLVVVEREFGTVTLRVAQRAAAFTKQELERIKNERAVTDSVLSSSCPQRLWHSAFEAPLERMTVTGDFGTDRIINGRRRSSHGGLDLRGSKGTPVKASNDGIVAFCGDHFYTGNSVYIDHGLGIFSMYFHLSRVLVHTGDKVHKDQIIGEVGSTGRSTAPHLHWAFQVNRARVNPISMLSLPVD